MDPKGTATVGSAAVETVEDDPTSTAMVGVAEQGRVELGAQGRSATQDQCNEQVQGVLVKDSYSEERAADVAWTARSTSSPEREDELHAATSSTCRRCSVNCSMAGTTAKDQHGRALRSRPMEPNRGRDQEPQTPVANTRRQLLQKS